MTKPRTEPYVWVTWLSRLMAGDVRCQWAPWFKTHYTGYAQAPSDFQLAAWTVEHTQLLDELVKERAKLGEGIYREVQNAFRVRRPSGLVIAGKPDLIAIDQRGHCTVYDAKTGKPRQSDIIQVMLYIMFLPYASPLYEGKDLSGCLVYKDGSRSDIPHKSIDDAFQNNVTYFLDILESTSPPIRMPHSIECRFCDITNADCPDRKEAEELDLTEYEGPEITV